MPTKKPKTKDSKKKDTGKKKEETELTEDELVGVSGGATIRSHDISVNKIRIDKSLPTSPVGGQNQ